MVTIKILLLLSAIYSAVMYAILAVESIRYKTDRETETFHLGLCFILCLGFLGLMGG